MARGPQETSRPVPAPARDEPSAEAVAAYLENHPRFLAEHPHLLDGLSLPAPEGDGRVVDLRSALIERLRAQVAKLSALRDEMIAAGRNNMSVQSRTHEAVIALISAQSFEQLIERATSDLAVMLDLDVATLGVEQKAEDLPPVRVGGVFQLEPGTVDYLVGLGRQVRLRPDVAGDPLLYGAGAGLVRSDALVRLTISPATPPALLALGSREEGHFHPSQATELLSFLGQALAECIRVWLDLPE